MDIKALSADGVDKAWAAIASVLVNCTLRDGPTITHNTTTDLDSATWAQSASLSAFFWDEQEKENETGDQKAMDTSLPSRKRMAMIRRSDCPGITEITTKAELVEGANLWHVYHAEAPPGDAIFILSLRR